jgi:DNA polymerase
VSRTDPTGPKARADYPGAASFVPAEASLRQLAEAVVQACRGCDLYRDATQAVLGQGPARATVALVGEQPGDQEDRACEPFVGPAGRLLDGARADAGLTRTNVFVTNVVKHFRFTRPLGKQRMPTGGDRFERLGMGHRES